jgi:hypothetical protein
MKKKVTKPKKGIYKLLSIVNDNKFFAGIIMLTMNIGSKYVSIKLSKTQENYVKYSLGRQILVFAILWMGTRDIFTSLVLTAVFILLADYLFNENSKFCVIPNKYKELDDKQINEDDVNEAINTLKIAQKNKNKDNDDSQINNILYKENFI